MNKSKPKINKWQMRMNIYFLIKLNMKHSSKIKILNRLCTKVWCKFKKNTILTEYFKDKREELENKPKTRIQYIFWKIKKELEEFVNR